MAAALEGLSGGARIVRPPGQPNSFHVRPVNTLSGRFDRSLRWLTTSITSLRSKTDTVVSDDI